MLTRLNPNHQTTLRHRLGACAAFYALSLGLLPAAYADAFLDRAKQKVTAATASKTEWDGPTTGPAAAPGKTLVFVGSDMRNGGPLGVSRGVQEAAQFLGWTVRILDGQGTVQGRTAALNQAIALKPDGILLGNFDAKEQSQGVRSANAAGIPVVGYHAAKEAAAVDGMFVNITTPADDVAEIAALYAIASSEGKAGVVIFTDSAYSAAIAKSDAMAEIIKQCAGCTLLGVEDTPLADTSNRMPQITATLLQRHGEKWTHALGINDLYFDFIGPTLQTAGALGRNLQTISAGDGSESAYQRIRRGRFQHATVPEPLNMHGWQMVDEINRAMHGQAHSGYVTKVHLVIQDNITRDGGDQNQYDPNNGYRAAYQKIWRP